jgi:hypothetical protein
MKALSLSTILAPQDTSAVVRRYVFPGFLIFSVCFYSYRFLFGMGSSLTTYYDSDAPTWLRILKDGVWVAVLLVGLVFSNAESWEFTRRNRQEHATFFRALFALVMLFLIMAVIHLFYFQSAMDTFLYWIRYPLEYVPLAFFLPLFVLRWRPLAPLLLGLGWLSVAFLAFEMFSGKQMGFFNRYGSILGSPNDYGMFCGLFIIGLLVCARRWSDWLLLAFMTCGLFLTLSRSAMIGTLAAICSLLYLRRARIGALAAIVLLGSLIAVLLWRFPDVFSFQQVQYALAHFDVDSSALSRLNELQIFRTRFGDFDLGTLLFGTDYFHIESWYLALLIRTGIFGLLLWLAVMAVTLLRGWRYRHLSHAHAVAFASVIGIGVASAFIPYPDTFPTNLYLWVAVGTIWMPLFRESSPSLLA